MRTSPPRFVIATLHACAVHTPVEASLSYSFSAYGKNISKILKAVDLLARPKARRTRSSPPTSAFRPVLCSACFRPSRTSAFPSRTSAIPSAARLATSSSNPSSKKLPNLSMPQVSLTPRESLVLYFLLARDSIFADSEVEHDLASLKSKLAALLPAATATPSGGRTAMPLSSLFTVLPMAISPTPATTLSSTPFSMGSNSSALSTSPISLRSTRRRSRTRSIL